MVTAKSTDNVSKEMNPLASYSKFSISRLRSAVSTRTWAYRAGNTSLRSGDLATAEHRVTTATDGFNDRPAWIQRLGFIQEKRGKLREALSSYRRAIALDNSVAEWYYRAGVCARLLLKLEEANELFQHAIDRDGSHERAAQAMVATLPKGLPGWRRMELLEKAICVHPSANTVREAVKLAYSMRRFDDVVRLVGLQRDQGAEDVDDLVILGSSLASKGEITAAYDVLSDAGRRSKVKKVGLHGPGVLLDLRGEWEAAAQIHDTYWHATGRENAHAAFGVAYALDRQYRWQESLEWYERALFRSSSHPAYWAYKYAHALERVGDFAKAADWYSRALYIGKGTEWDWYYRLGFCMYKTARLEEAIVALQRWLTRRRDDHFSPDHTGNCATRCNSNLSYQGGPGSGPLGGEEFDAILAAKSFDISNDIDAMAQGPIRISKKFAAVARQFRAAGYFEKAHDAYDTAYQASGHAAVDVLLEWVDMLVDHGDLHRVCSVLLDHREFERPDGLDLKKLIKSDYDRRKLRYAEYRERFNVVPKTVLFESFWGSRINDNPMAIYSAMIRDSRFDGARFYWTWDEKCKIPDGIGNDGRTIIVRYGTAHYDRVLATTEILVNNTSFVEYFTRRDGQRYLNTWHGTPIKTLGRMIRTGILEHANVARNLLQCTDLLLPNQYTADRLNSDYDISGLRTFETQIVGSPRLDALLAGSNQDSDAVYVSIGLDLNPDEKNRIVFYAPTWRGSASSKGQDVDLARETLQILAKDECSTVLYRPHHLVPTDAMPELPSNVKLVDDGVDTYDILSVTDVLVTDYSSLLFDFIATGRLAICYVPDVEEYREERGLYMDPLDVVTEVANSPAELSSLLANEWPGPDETYLDSQRQFAAVEDGGASNRVLDIILQYESGASDSDLPYSPRERIVFFESMIPNGIRSSFENLCSQIDKTRYELILVLDAAAVANDSERITGLKNLPDSMAVVGRTGSALSTLEERYALNRFAKNHGQVSEELEQLVNISYQREFQRVLGRPLNVRFVDFEGYSRFWNGLFSRGVPESCTSGVILHNQIPREAAIRFPYLKEIVSNYSYFDSVASVATAIAEDNQLFAVSLGVDDANKMSVVHNTLDIAGIRAAASGKSLWSEDSSSALKIVAVGRLSPEKNHALMLESVNKLRMSHPDVRLMVLGDGPSRSSLESMVVSMGLTGNVELAGYVGNPMPTIAGADVMAISSLHEGQPMVLLEAMCLGTPVVTTPVPGCVEAVNLGAGMVADYNAQSFSEALSEASRMDSTRSFDAKTYNSMAMSEFSEFVNSMRLDAR